MFHGQQYRDDTDRIINVFEEAAEKLGLGMNLEKTFR